MHRTSLVVALVVCFVTALVRGGSAQQPGGLTIRSVTMDSSGSVLTITGTGFGLSPVVTVDGQPVTVLSGGSDAQVRVLSPAPLATTPGTYRLTVSDPQQQSGDVFVVASGAGMVSAISAPVTGTGTSAGGTARQSVAPGAADLNAPGGRVLNAGPGTSLGLVEDSGSPYRTAIGYQALVSNQGSGIFNTAAGYGASFSNTTGTENTALGAFTLYYSTTGTFNTATGYQALIFNTGSFNTATGGFAGAGNTTGIGNAAFGYQSLYFNTIGSYNTAAGYRSMFTNSSGHGNVANGLHAMFSNTTGSTSTAIGMQSLYMNSTGSSNTGIGMNTLHSNTTGAFNTAVGSQAGFYPVAGNFNIFLGGEVYGEPSDTNTTRIGVPYNGAAMPPSGQNRTFISGIRGTAVSGGLPVVIDAGGQLGTAGGISLSLHDGTNTQPIQLRVGHVSGVSDYGIGRNPVDGVLDFSATQPTYSGFRFNTPNTGTIMALTSEGLVGIGIVAPSQPLQMASGAYVSWGGVWTNASSRALKDRIAPVSAAVAAQTLAQLTPVTFVYKASPSESHVGFIAEDVPDLVASTDRRGLAAMDLVAVVTRVVQTQQQQLEDQQATIDELRARLTQLESLLATKSSVGVPR